MNPSLKWDLVPVFGVYMMAPGDVPVGGTVKFSLSQRITRTDGRTIYPDGAKVTATIGAADEQDPTVRAAVRAAWRAHDEATVPGFDGLVWDEWWDTKVLPAAIFTGFPASDDPDVQQRDWQVMVEESLSQGSGKKYAIQPLLAHLEHAIPGINLGMVEVPPDAPNVPAPVYMKGIAGGVAALDADGDVLDAGGNKIGGVTPGDIEPIIAQYLVDNPPDGVSSWDDLTDKPVLGTAAAQDVSAFATASQGAKADTATQGGYIKPGAGIPKADLATAVQTSLGKADTALQDAGSFATAAQGTKADSAVQPAAIANFVPNTRTVAGKALTANVTLAKGDVGLGSVDNTSDVSKPVSTAQAAALEKRVRYVQWDGGWPPRGPGGLVMFMSPLNPEATPPSDPDLVRNDLWARSG